MLWAQAWKPGSQHAGEKRGLAGLLLGRTERAASHFHFHQEAFELLFTFCHKGGVICISEVIDISPGNLDSSLCFLQLLPLGLALGRPGLPRKLESRWLGEISITSDMQMTLPLWQKVKRS